MEKPGFIKDFSKRTDQEGRDQLAAEIREKRSAHFEHERKLVELEEKRNAEIAQILAEINEIKAQIESVQESTLGKILDFFKMNSELAKLREQLVAKEEVHEALEGQKLPEPSQYSEIQREARGLVSRFYEKVEKEWIETDYTEEELRELFTEENLSKMSYEEYILFLRRFPGYALTHVTRQGVRDHTGHAYHTAGTGEFSDGFVEMAKSGRLRTPLSLMMTREHVGITLEEHFCEEFESEEEALENLRRFIDPAMQDSGSYIDRNAIHFASEEVADCYYGSETGNEIFIVYPSALVVNEYKFQGDLDNAAGGYWNDVWVWDKEQAGFDLNAGVVFLPKSTLVDPENGSRYKIGPEGNPVKRTELIEQTIRLAENEELRSYISGVSGEKYARYFSDDPDLASEAKTEIYNTLVEKFGVPDELAKFLAENRYSNINLESLLSDFEWTEKNIGVENRSEALQERIEELLMSGQLLYDTPDVTCSSQEYWEKLMESNGIELSKVVYYDGDPTLALHRWRKENGIKKTKAGESDFPTDHRVLNYGVEDGFDGVDRFESIARDIIHNYFSERNRNVSSNADAIS